MFSYGFGTESLVYAAGLVQAAGYLVINQIILRILILIGTGLYILYYSLVGDAPLWEAIYMSALIGAATLAGLCGLVWRGSTLAIPARHRDIYPLFAPLPPGDFRDLIRMADRFTARERSQISAQGKPQKKLYYAISGRLRVEKRGVAFDMPGAVFVGEVAFMTNQTSAASTWAEPGTELLVWDVAALRRQADRKARFRLALDSMIAKDLAIKVAFAVAPKKPDWEDVARIRATL